MAQGHGVAGSLRIAVDQSESVGYNDVATWFLDLAISFWLSGFLTIRGNMIESRANFRVRPDDVEEAVAAVGEFVAAIAENEPRTTIYHSYQDMDDPTRFLHVMRFEDEEARAVHIDTDHVHRFVNRLYPLCDEQPVFVDIRTVAAR